MEINCDNCGINFKRKPSEVSPNYNCCSKSCGYLYKTKLHDKNRVVMKFFENTWTSMNIRCGKYVNSQTIEKCKSYINVSINFTRDEYKTWCFKNRQTIESLNRPSIDRIDSDGDYCINNIRVIELVDNIKSKRVGCSYVNGPKSGTLRGIRKSGNRFSARIRKNKKEVYLGTFDTEYEAYIIFHLEYTKEYGIEPFNLSLLEDLI